MWQQGIQRSRKKDKGVILDEFTKLTGYGRRYASHVLRSHGKKVRINDNCVIQGDVRKSIKRNKPKVYDAMDVSEKDKQALKKIYATLNPAQLKRQITKLQDRLLKLNLQKRGPRKKAAA